MSLFHVQITPQLVDAVREAVDIVDVASEHTRLKKEGRRMGGLCPLHREKTPSFSIDPVQGLFYCFGCGSGGDAIKLHMLLSGDDFPAAIEALAQRYSIPLPSRLARRSADGDLEGALQAAEAFFESQLEGSAKAVAYLAGRGISVDLQRRFHLGYAEDSWDALCKALTPRFPERLLRAAGLTAVSEKNPDRTYDRFRDRLIFPIRSPSGRLVGFGGRTLGDDRAKYINSQESDAFHKGKLLYGLDQAKRHLREGAPAILVEGYFDALAVAAAGVEGAVATMGTALTVDQAKLVARYSDTLVVAYDGDSAGEGAHQRALPILLAQGLVVRRAVFPAGSDPDDVRQSEGSEALATRLAEAPDAVQREIERLTPAAVRREPQEQARAGREIAELLTTVTDPLLRHGYAKRAAERIDVPVNLLLRRRARRASTATSSQPLVRPAHGEEAALAMLLSCLSESAEEPPLAPLPHLQALPPAEVFFEPTLRNIFEEFRDLYGEGRPPSRWELQGRLTGQAEALDAWARIRLERPATAPGGDLQGIFAELGRRWNKERRKALDREMREAQENGDEERLEALLAERTRLNRVIHGRPFES